MSAHVDDFVLDYLLGEMPESGRLALERHARACEQCKALVKDAADGLAAVALASQELSPSCKLKERIIETVLSARYRYAPFVDRLCELAAIGEKNAMDLLEHINDPKSWVDSPWPPLKMCAFKGGAGLEHSMVALAKLPVGGRFPLHRHVGEERYMILQGRCQEDDGRESKAGDVLVQPSGSQHAFVNIGDSELIFAVVVDDIELL
ncbi:MAG: cupin domain-containing protein [Myxococcota bacterium]|jgi:quercetin dioxygenase-like cupin family protein|nr:cupin domain-containing protein [Myxococcota bacterium]